MSSTRTNALIVVLALLLSANPAAAADSSVATAKRGMLATVHPLATKAGIEAFQAGGNAVDAAISAAVMLGVVDSHNSGLGGGCFILVRTAGGEWYALDAREVAPLAATRDMYLRDGKADPKLSQTGPLAVAVPGAVAGYVRAQARHGRLPPEFAWRQAAAVAERGFAIDREFADTLRQEQANLKLFPGTAAVLLQPDGSPLEEGDVLRQPDLARVCNGIAEQGQKYFYEGPAATTIADWMMTNGGLLTAEDFRRYTPAERAPLVTTYRDWTVVGFPPPSSGGVHIAQMLNILENFDVAGIHQRDPFTVQHLLVETMKLAFADRAHWLGDPAYAKVPRGLVDKEYAKSLAAKIDLTKSTPVLSHGHPPDAQTRFFDKHTTHIAAADAEGNWVAITQTVNTTFGSKVIVPGTGIVLNNEMDDFSAQPGVPNAFGLIGAEANSIAPGKRPLSSMSPTIILQDGQPVLTVGAAGGPKIITQVLLAVVNHLDLKMEVGDAVGQARIHHQWSPDRVLLEKSGGKELFQALRAKGHDVQWLEYAGVTQAIARLPDGTFVGVHDPRVEGQAAGVD